MGTCACVPWSIQPQRWRRFARLVDGCYPREPGGGMHGSHYLKLDHYAHTKPRKLQKIFEYLRVRLQRAVRLHRRSEVKVTVDIANRLMASCHTDLNLFVEGYLQMIEHLLLSKVAELEVLGTKSFLEFANINEDTPSYDRRYGFFVNTFRAMSATAADDGDEAAREVQLSGLQGLRAIVRKTVGDVHANLWDSDMQLIVPTYLFAMHAAAPAPPVRHAARFASALALGARSTVDFPSPDTMLQERDPRRVAQCGLQDLVMLADLGQLRLTMGAILQHLDSVCSWHPNWFALEVFRVIMSSIQSQHFHVPILGLLHHVDADPDAEIKRGKVDVLAACVCVAGGAMVPSAMSTFHALFGHLLQSGDSLAQRQAAGGAGPEDSAVRQAALAHELALQDAIVDCMGELARCLPDYQIAEVVTSTASNWLDGPIAKSKSKQSPTAMRLLMRALLRIAERYAEAGGRGGEKDAVHPDLADRILNHALSEEADVAALAIRILAALLCRRTGLGATSATSMPPNAADGRPRHLETRLTPANGAVMARMAWAFYEVARRGGSEDMLAALKACWEAMIERFGYPCIVRAVPMLQALQRVADRMREQEAQDDSPAAQADEERTESRTGDDDAGSGKSAAGIYALVAACYASMARLMGLTALMDLVHTVVALRLSDPWFSARRPELYGTLVAPQLPREGHGGLPTVPDAGEDGADAQDAGEGHAASSPGMRVALPRHSRRVAGAGVLFETDRVVDILSTDAVLSREHSDLRALLSAEYEHAASKPWRAGPSEDLPRVPHVAPAAGEAAPWPTAQPAPSTAPASQAGPADRAGILTFDLMRRRLARPGSATQSGTPLGDELGGAPMAGGVTFDVQALSTVTFEDAIAALDAGKRASLYVLPGDIVVAEPVNGVATGAPAAAVVVSPGRRVDSRSDMDLLTAAPVLGVAVPQLYSY